jgi:hypothetical protein
MSQGLQVTNISQFPHLIFLDTLKECTLTLQNMKAKIPSLALSALSKFFKLPSDKDENMTYAMLHRLVTTYGSDISNVINYNVQDTIVTRELDQHIMASATKINFVTECNVPISMTCTATPSQCLNALILKRFRDNGYSVPYCTIRQELPPFKGAFTAVDGPCS